MKQILIITAIWFGICLPPCEAWAEEASFTLRSWTLPAGAIVTRFAPATDSEPGKWKHFPNSVLDADQQVEGCLVFVTWHVAVFQSEEGVYYGINKKQLSTEDAQYVAEKTPEMQRFHKERILAEGHQAAAENPMDESIWVPQLIGEAWQIGKDSPDVSPYTGGSACDYTIFRATDGTWQCIACIRGTSWSGRTRLFYRWEGASMDQSDWEPKGIFYKATPGIGLQTTNDSVQAPHMVETEDRFLMFYNSGMGGAYCMTSEDGKEFEHLKGEAGAENLFKMGRDVCVYEEDGTWHAYYCNNEMTYRSASAPEGPWSEESVLRSYGNPESPFVLKYKGLYYLWQQSNVIISDRLDSFEDIAIARACRGWAPEIIIDEKGNYYATSYRNGIWAQRLEWVKKNPAEIAQWRAENWATIRPEKPLYERIADSHLMVWLEADKNK